MRSSSFALRCYLMHVQVDERLNGDGVGLPFGINDATLGWVIVGGLTTVWALWFNAQKDLVSDVHQCITARVITVRCRRVQSGRGARQARCRAASQQCTSPAESCALAFSKQLWCSLALLASSSTNRAGDPIVCIVAYKMCVEGAMLSLLLMSACHVPSLLPAG